jgi:hypothetical protein
MRPWFLRKSSISRSRVNATQQDDIETLPAELVEAEGKHDGVVVNSSGGS